jgi:putative tryptophan/tyrosine transport system substrate-binding protein
MDATARVHRGAWRRGRWWRAGAGPTHPAHRNPDTFPTGKRKVQERVRVFREELRKRGWASSVNIQFDERWTVDNMELIHSAAENLVELKPDAILAIGGRVIPILMKLTRSIPIVVPGGAEPVARGYVESLAHPGGNVTGFAVMEASVIGKQLQTLKEIAAPTGLSGL